MVKTYIKTCELSINYIKKDYKEQREFNKMDHKKNMVSL